MEKEIKTKVANGVKKVAVISGMIIETILFLLFLSPVDNNNNKLDNLEKKVYASRTKKILLFDDIYTTGNTAQSCARELANNGAEQICALTLAIHVQIKLPIIAY